MQEAEPQAVLLEAWTQFPEPSHIPVLPQVPLLPHPPLGSGLLLATFTHNPLAPQAWQVAQLGTPQQMLLTQ